MANSRAKISCPAEDERLSRFTHDMRARLYVINGTTELLLDGALGPFNDEQKRSLTDILESGRRLITLLNAYLEPPTETGSTDGIAQKNTHRR